MTDREPGAGREPLFRTKGDVLIDLEQRLMAGQFPVGSKLPSERVLVGEYSVSRPVIREVLSGLLERGYIEVYAGRGSFVRALHTGDLTQSVAHVASRGGATARDLVAARLMLESTAAELAARNADPDEHEEIRRALKIHGEADTVRSAADTDLSLHEAIVRASHNPLLTIMFGSIQEYVRALMLRSHSDRTVRNAGDPLHEVILERILARDPAGARAAMTEHLGLALDYYGGDLDIPLVQVLQNRGFDPEMLRAVEHLPQA